MKLSKKETLAVSMLRKLDGPQRENILAEIHRTVIANQITKKAGGLKKVMPVLDHKIIKAYGKVPPWRKTKKP